MDKFWKQFERSTVTSGILAILVVGTACYCTVTQTPAPEYLSFALGAIIGFFFSSKMKDEAQARKTG